MPAPDPPCSPLEPPPGWPYLDLLLQVLGSGHQGLHLAGGQRGAHQDSTRGGERGEQGFGAALGAHLGVEQLPPPPRGLCWRGQMGCQRGAGCGPPGAPPALTGQQQQQLAQALLVELQGVAVVSAVLLLQGTPGTSRDAPGAPSPPGISSPPPPQGCWQPKIWDSPWPWPLPPPPARHRAAACPWPSLWGDISGCPQPSSSPPDPPGAGSQPCFPPKKQNATFEDLPGRAALLQEAPAVGGDQRLQLLRPRDVLPHLGGDRDGVKQPPRGFGVTGAPPGRDGVPPRLPTLTFARMASLRRGSLSSGGREGLRGPRGPGGAKHQRHCSCTQTGRAPAPSTSPLPGLKPPPAPPGPPRSPPGHSQRRAGTKYSRALQ